MVFSSWLEKKVLSKHSMYILFLIHMTIKWTEWQQRNRAQLGEAGASPEPLQTWENSVIEKDRATTRNGSTFAKNYCYKGWKSHTNVPTLGSRNKPTIPFCICPTMEGDRGMERREEKLGQFSGKCNKLIKTNFNRSKYMAGSDYVHFIS